MEQEIEEVEFTMSNTLSKTFSFEKSDYDSKIVSKLFEEYKYKSASEALSLAAQLALELAGRLEYNDPLRTKAAQVFNACEGWIEDECELVKDE